MSRIGKQLITIPKGTDITVENNIVIVKGPQGELQRTLPLEISVSIENDVVTVAPTRKTQKAKMLWGTYTSHIRNMVMGVNEKYEKKLVIEGVGFKAEIQGNKLIMQLGFSHPVELDVPPELEVSVEKGVVSVSGIDKEKVGHFSAIIRAQKKPEPYKGKGIHYSDEVVRRKQGKKAITAG